MTGPFLSLGRALVLTTARAFLPAAAALLSGTLLFAAIPFGGDGMRPGDVVHVMARSPATRLALWSVWVALSSPVGARLVDASWVRTLPVRTTHAVIWILALGAVAQIPWMLLFGLGDGPLRGAANGLLALALGLASTAGARIYLGAAIVAALTPLPSIAALGAAIVVASLSARRAWIAGAHESGGPMRIVRRAPMPVAVALAGIAELVRSRRVVVVRTAGLGVALAIVGSLLHRHQPASAPAELARALAILAVPSAIAAAWMGAPLAATAASLEPVVTAMGAPARVVHAGNLLAVLPASCALGVAMGATLPDPFYAAPSLAAWSACIGAAVYARLRRDVGARGAVSAALVGIAALAATLAIGRLAIAFFAAWAVATSLRERA